MNYELYTGAQPGQRVADLTWQGRPVEAEETYRVVMEASHLEDEAFPACTVLWWADSDMQYAATGGTMAALLATYASRNGAVLPQRDSSWAVYPGTADSPLTRLEFVELLHEAAGKPRPGADVAFVDIADSDAVVWAAESRIVSGDGKGMFLPQSLVTREQAAAMLYHYARAEGMDLTTDGGAVNSLSDGASVSGWAMTAVDFCLKNSLMEPVDGQFRPAATITRSEARKTMEVLNTLE